MPAGHATTTEYLSVACMCLGRGAPSTRGPHICGLHFCAANAETMQADSASRIVTGHVRYSCMHQECVTAGCVPEWPGRALPGSR